MQPTTSGILETNGGRIYYEVAGEGHPFVLIHAGIATHRMWDEQFALFAQRYRVIRYDTRGFGNTTTDEVPFSNRQDLLDLLDFLKVERAYVMGVSRGGQIATDFTLEFPQRVAALIWVCGGIGGFDFQSPEVEMQKFVEMEALEAQHDHARLIEMEIEVWVDGFYRAVQADPKVREQVREMLRVNYAKGDSGGKPIALQPPAAGRLHEIRVPTLVLVGEFDTKATQAMADAMAERVPGARKVVIRNTVHMPNLEKPDEFNRLVLDFLARV